MNPLQRAKEHPTTADIREFQAGRREGKRGSWRCNTSVEVASHTTFSHKSQQKIPEDSLYNIRAGSASCMSRWRVCMLACHSSWL